MDDFINKFKQTLYYKALFDIDEEIVLIYLGGSRCYRTVHEQSDYDVNVITMGGKFKNERFEQYLKYKDKLVHWYYRPIQDFFDGQCTNLSNYSGILTLRGITDDVILYKNPKYEQILDKLYALRDELFVPVCYEIFNFAKDLIINILDNNGTMPEHRWKTLYYLCLASYCLLAEPFDVDFLRTLNIARHVHTIPDEDRNKVIERLTLYKNYVEQNPIDVQYTLKALYSRLENEILCAQED